MQEGVRKSEQVSGAAGVAANEEDWRWLVEHADAELRAAPRTDDLLKLAAFFRARHSIARSRLLTELRDLRRRGKTKFSRAQQMFFTRVSLEQATDEILASYKARRFPAALHVVDLCCGLGGDAMGLSARGPITAIDKNSLLAMFATANLKVTASESPAQVRCADIENVELSTFDMWHLDPDRREGGQRRSAPARYVPAVDEFLRSHPASPDGAIKLAPAASVDMFGHQAEMEWIGHRRQCQQLVAWFGGLARHPGRRVATWLYPDANGQQRVATLIDQFAEPAPVAHSLMRYLYEPQPPVLAAGIENTLAAQHDLARVAPNVSYFVSARKVDDPLLDAFEVLAALPLRVKPVRECIASLDGYVVEVKKRGVNVDPHQLQRQLATEGSIPLSIVLVAMGKSVRAVVARRLQA